MDENTKQTVRIFNSSAEKYQEKYMDVSPYEESLIHLNDAIDTATPFILDVACGPGNVSRFIQDRRPVSKILAVDLAPKMLELAAQNLKNVSTRLLDARRINEIDDTFDVVLLAFLFPYLNLEDVQLVLARSCQILKPNGLIYLSTMQADTSDKSSYKLAKRPEITIHYYNMDVMVKILENLDVDVFYSNVQPYDYGADNRGEDIILIAKKRP